MDLRLKEAKEVLLELIRHVNDLKTSEEKEEYVASLNEALEYELCKLTLLAVPEATTKIAEIVYAKEMDHEVSDKRNGADMFTKDGSRLEHKLSKVTQKTNYRCNVNIPFPKADTQEERRTKMVDSINEKTKGPSGGMVIQIACKNTGETMHEYFLSNLFLTSYFEDLATAKFPGPKVSNVNWGCSRCKKCKTYHRLDEMKKMDEKLSVLAASKRAKFKRKNDAWAKLVSGAEVKAQC